MAKVLMEGGSGKLVSDDGTTWEVRVSYDTEETSGLPFLLIHCYQNDIRRGTPDRYKLSGNRLAADKGAVDGDFFITDSDGFITNG